MHTTPTITHTKSTTPSITHSKSATPTIMHTKFTTPTMPMTPTTPQGYLRCTAYSPQTFYNTYNISYCQGTCKLSTIHTLRGLLIPKLLTIHTTSASSKVLAGGRNRAGAGVLGLGGGDLLVAQQMGAAAYRPLFLRGRRAALYWHYGIQV